MGQKRYMEPKKSKTNATKENKDFHTIKEQELKGNTLVRVKRGRGEIILIVNAAELHRNFRGTQPIVEAAQDWRSSATLYGYAETTASWC